MATSAYVVGQRSADQLRRVLQSPPSGPRPKRGEPTAPVWGLVRCTSATAAGGSGVPAALYPGTRVTGDATSATPADGGTVWLTVLGSGGSPAVPVSGQVYPCLIGGRVDVSGDERPRAIGPSLLTGPAGFTGTKTVVVSASFNTSTCVFSAATETWTFTNGRLTGVA